MVQVNSVPQYYTVRIKFKKCGDLQYISHLDLVRTMNKIITRADFPLWYTEGYNPKPKMVFAAPLSIGVESVCEFMDLRLTEKIPTEEIKRRLNKNMTEDMQVLEAYYPDAKITELAFLEYEIAVKTAGVSSALAEKCDVLLHENEIKVMKKTKSGEAESDIKPLIHSCEVCESGGLLLLRCILSAAPSAFLNPEYIVGYLKSRAGILADPVITNEWYAVLRTRAYRADMSEFK